MNQTYTVRCPDCGSLGIRTHFSSGVDQKQNCTVNETIETKCPSCDYLLVTCSVSGRVIDAHSSTASVVARKRPINNERSIAVRSTSIIPLSIQRSA